MAAMARSVWWGNAVSFNNRGGRHVLAQRRRVLLAGLLLAALSFAPAPPADQTQLSSLAEARHQAALKQYEETWAYYQQARIDSYQVYVWSKLILDCRREMTEKPAERSGRASKIT